MTSFLQTAFGACVYTRQDEYRSEVFIDHELLQTCLNQANMEKWTEVIDTLLAARNLPDDWDGQGAKAPTHEAVDTSLKLAMNLRGLNCLPPDDFGAGVEGVLTLGWHLPHFAMVVEISSPLRVEGYRWFPGDERAERFILMIGK